MKLYKHGMLLGKFLPLHSGHLHMINTALKQCEKLTILICSLEREVIPGYMRYTWIKNIFPDVNVIHITDEIPQYPETCDEGPQKFWEIWTDVIKRNMPKDLDVWFSSEDYGDEIARRFGIKSVIVDKQRIVVPISATEIRRQPLNNWKMIPPEVRAYYVRKVCIVGPESTGKTVLSQGLADHYRTAWVPEYGRQYVDSLRGRHWDIMDLSHIAAGQMHLEDKIAKFTNKLLICDTDVMTTQTWSELYFNTVPMWMVRASYQSKYDLHLLMAPDVPWIDDGSREVGNQKTREKHFNLIEKELKARHWKYEIITGPFEGRLQKAIEIINREIPEIAV
jgi:NadR type nicotinamide-nucleotide adenylyltransferase